MVGFNKQALFCCFGHRCKSCEDAVIEDALLLYFNVDFGEHIERSALHSIFAGWLWAIGVMTELGPENQKGTNHLCHKLKQKADISRHHH